MGGPEQQFCLRWNNHQSTLVSVFESLLESETLVDVTLAAEGRYLKAHKVVLCACSPFFQDVLSNHLEKYPIIVLKDVTFQELKALIDYMYRGEVNVSQEQLAALIKTAESLKIKGLADGNKNKPSSSSSTPAPASSPAAPPPPPPPPIESPVNNVTAREGSASPLSRKRRKRSRRRSGDSLEPESVESSLSEPPLDEETNKERVIRALGLVPPSALLNRTSTAAPGLMEPKVEDIDEESVDLMMDEDDDAKSDVQRPGPSHEGIQAAAGGASSGGTSSLGALYTLVGATSNNTSFAPPLPAPPSKTHNMEVWPPVYLTEKFIVEASGRSVEITTRKYSASVVKSALEEVLNYGMTMSKASETFNIKRSTLYFYFKKLYPDPVEFNNKLSKLLQ